MPVTFLWPEMLWFLVLVPLLVATYVACLRKSRKAAIRYASLSLMKQAMRGRSLRRHVPPLLFLLGVVAMGLADAATLQSTMIAGLLHGRPLR